MNRHELEVRVVAPVEEAHADDWPHCHTCSRRLARFAGPGDEQGWTCVVCEDPTAAMPGYDPAFETCPCETVEEHQARACVGAEPVEVEVEVEACSCEEALWLHSRIIELEGRVSELVSECRSLRERLKDANEGVGYWKATAARREMTARFDLRRRSRLDEAVERAHAKAATGEHWLTLAARADAEQRVLDASHLILDTSLRRIREVEGGCLGDWAAAELARREAAR